MRIDQRGQEPIDLGHVDNLQIESIFPCPLCLASFLPSDRACHNCGQARSLKPYLCFACGTAFSTWLGANFCEGFHS